MTSLQKVNSRFELVNLFLSSMRPSQWTKNLVIFAGLIFAEYLLDIKDLLLACIAFILFCLLSSSIYIINDILDFERDRVHPDKRYRPIASGKLTRRSGLILAIFLSLFSMSGAFVINYSLLFIEFSYFILNLLYSFRLKKIPILDILSISLSFVLRAVAGVVIINVIISPWLLVCTFLLALFMAIGKRRGELLLLEKNHSNHREVLSEYSVQFLDQMISIVSSSILIAYSLYTFTSGKSINLMITIPFVIYGIFRYLYLVYQLNKGDNPTSIFISDRPLQINMTFWLVIVLVIFYWKQIKEFLKF